jgi:hypothetical protein
MIAEFETVHNYCEQAVFRHVMVCAADFPQFARDVDVLADIACVALNRLPPRYIRNAVDMNFFMSKQDRAKMDAAVDAAVTFAFRFMQSRTASRPTMPASVQK